VILFGPPGAGKGTQAKLLRDRLHLTHISTGDMLRRHIEVGDEIGRQSDSVIKSGKLVSDDVVNQLVRERIAEPGCRNGIILDGYPRTRNQARVLLELLKQQGLTPAVVHLSVDHERIVARLSGRLQCPVCGTLYSVITNPPKKPGTCDVESAALITREDDSEFAIRQRLETYEATTQPILSFFREVGVSVFDVDGADGTPEQIAERICGLVASSVFGRATAPVRETPVASVRS